MKNLTKTLILVAALIMTIASCKKVDDIKILNADGEALKEANWKNIQKAAQEFSISLSGTSSEEITSEKGMKVTFNSNSFIDKQGNIVTGNIDIELIEIYEKADMVLMNKSTMGKLPNGDHTMLRSGGQFRLSAEKDGEALALNTPIMVQVPVNNTGGEQADMKWFLQDDDCDDDGSSFKPRVKGKPHNNGCPVIDDEIVWEEADNNVNPAGQGGIWVEDFASVTFYNGFVENFGWTNVDKFMSYTGEKTTLKVQAPEGYDNTNIAIYLSYVGEPNGLATLDAYLEDEGVFTEHYGQIPVGQEVNIIAVSIVEGEYSATVANNGATIVIEEGATIVVGELDPITEAELITQINNLP